MGSITPPEAKATPSPPPPVEIAAAPAAVAGGTHRREVADEIRPTGDHLDDLRGEAPRGQPEPDVVGEGALAQLQHHPIGTGDLAEMGAGAADGGGADEQRRRQLDQGRRGVEQVPGIEHQVVEADGDAAAQLVAIAVEAGAEGPSRRTLCLGWCPGRSAGSRRSRWRP